jgi:hypothetical protein
VAAQHAGVVQPGGGAAHRAAWLQACKGGWVAGSTERQHKRGYGRGENGSTCVSYSNVF